MQIGLDASYRGYKLFRQAESNFNNWIYNFQNDGFNLKDVDRVVNDLQR